LFELELKKISALGEVVSHINCRKIGDYRWDEATSIQYFSDILSFPAEFLEDHPYIGRFGREVDVMGGSPHHFTGISYQACGSGVLNHPTKLVNYWKYYHQFNELLTYLNGTP